MFKFDAETLKAEQNEQATIRELIRENNELRQEIAELKTTIAAYREALGK